MIFHSKLISQERTIKKDTDIFRKSKKVRSVVCRRLSVNRSSQLPVMTTARLNELMKNQ